MRFVVTVRDVVIALGLAIILVGALVAWSIDRWSRWRSQQRREKGDGR